MVLAVAFYENLVGSSTPGLTTAQTRPGTNSTSSSETYNSSEELLDSWVKWSENKVEQSN